MVQSVILGDLSQWKRSLIMIPWFTCFASLKSWKAVLCCNDVIGLYSHSTIKPRQPDAADMRLY